MDSQFHEDYMKPLPSRRTYSMKTRVIAWWSGGITSAVACLWAVQTFKNVVVVFQDTKNEDDDTYRFLKDCENLYNQPIELISRIGKDYKSIEDIWFKV